MIPNVIETASDYEGLNVRGKLVLADINQRDEWWINYPVYQAYLKGAVGLIAVQTQGYAEIDPRALNAQDIAGPEYAPAFSLSRQDASYLKELLCPEDPAVSHPSSVAVELNASSWVERNRPAYNITGYLPGTAASEGDDRMILLSTDIEPFIVRCGSTADIDKIISLESICLKIRLISTHLTSMHFTSRHYLDRKSVV